MNILQYSETVSHLSIPIVVESLEVTNIPIWKENRVIDYLRWKKNNTSVLCESFWTISYFNTKGERSAWLGKPW